MFAVRVIQAQLVVTTAGPAGRPAAGGDAGKSCLHDALYDVRVAAINVKRVIIK